MNRTHPSRIGAGLAGALAVMLAGCVVPGPHGYHGRRPPAGVGVPTGYVYYPGYQVYYSGNTRQYVYLDGSAWVTRPAPAHVSVDVLYASPSVTLDFYDAPSVHHATVVQTYPKNWTPHGWSHGNKGGKKEDHDNGKRNGEKGRE